MFLGVYGKCDVWIYGIEVLLKLVDFFTWLVFQHKRQLTLHTFMISIYKRIVIPMFTPFQLQDNWTFRSPPSKKHIGKQFWHIRKCHLLQKVFKLHVLWSSYLFIKQEMTHELFITHCTKGTSTMNPFSFINVYTESIHRCIRHVSDSLCIMYVSAYNMHCIFISVYIVYTST